MVELSLTGAAIAAAPWIGWMAEEPIGWLGARGRRAVASAGIAAWLFLAIALSTDWTFSGALADAGVVLVACFTLFAWLWRACRVRQRLLRGAGLFALGCAAILFTLMGATITIATLVDAPEQSEMRSLRPGFSCEVSLRRVGSPTEDRDFQISFLEHPRWMPFLERPCAWTRIAAEGRPMEELEVVRVEEQGRPVAVVALAGRDPERVPLQRR